MELDLHKLTPLQFEKVVSALLAQSGYREVAPTRWGQPSPGFIANNEAGQTLFVEAKHYKQSLPAAVVAQFAGDVVRYRAQSPTAKGLIVLSDTLSKTAAARIADHPELDVWTGEDVLRMLSAYPGLTAAISSSIEASQALSALSMVSTATPPPRPEYAKYAEYLKKIDAGRGDWAKFEIWCADILTDIFKPDLGPPDRQTRSDDGLDIMDAIFPIRAEAPPWGRVRAEFTTRFVVAEFKNNVDPIGQKQVESIAQYLWEKAMRQFGILVSRQDPGDSAIAQRRRVWLENSKMIIFLSASDLVEMLQARETGEEPFNVIDVQLEAFLRTLTP